VVVTSNNPQVQAINDTAEGDFSAIPFGFAGNVGYDIPIGAATITPTGSLEYLAAYVDGFSEDPVDSGLELRYDDQYIDSLTLSAGASVDYAISTSFGVVVPSIRGELVQQFLTDPSGVQIEYASDETAGTLSRFTSTPDSVDPTYGILGATLSGQFADGWGAFVDYSAVVGLRDFTIQAVNLGLRKSF
jgi:outer membrane autotransporter protein